MSVRKYKNSIPLERQLEDLASCGITLNPDVTIDHLLKSYGREDFEKDPHTSRLYHG